MLILVNVDDISGELLPHVIDGLLTRGAENVHAIQSVTKKGRVGYVLLIDTPAEHLDDLGIFLVSEVGTIGMRLLETQHIQFEYRVRQMRLTVRGNEGFVRAPVRVKEIYDRHGQVISIKAEYEDLRSALARFERAGVEISLTALKRLVEQRGADENDSSHEHIGVEAIEEVRK